MASATHTPGPWSAQAGTTTGQEVIAPDAPKTRRTVARCGGKDREANALLIAAAPALLRVATMLHYVASLPYGDGLHRSALEDAVREARSAIARATAPST